MNTLVSWALWRWQKDRAFLYTTQYWFAIVIIFLTQGLADENSLLIMLSASISLYPLYIMTDVVPRGIFDNNRFRLYLLGMATCVTISIMFWLSDSPFWLVNFLPSLFLMGVAFNGALFLFKRREVKLSGVYGVILFLFGLHLMDFPFLRDQKELLPWGFALGLFFGISFGMILPVFIVSRSMKRKVDEKNSSIELLFNILCHDLSLPLTLMGHSLKKIEVSNGPHLTNGAMKRLSQSQKAMEEILTHVKILKKIEEDSGSLLSTDIDLQKIVDELLYFHREWIEGKGITIRFDEKDKLSIYGEETSLKNQILNHLITNAIKFTPSGGEISLGLEDKDELVQLTIKNTGSYIPNEEQKKLFNFTEKKLSLGTDGERGAGLGLPILKHFLKKFGGTISVNSNDDGDKSTTFTLLLRKGVV